MVCREDMVVNKHCVLCLIEWARLRGQRPNELHGLWKRKMTICVGYQQVGIDPPQGERPVNYDQTWSPTVKSHKSVWVCGAHGATPKIHYPQKAHDCEYKYEMNNNDHCMSSKMTIIHTWA